MDLSGARVYVVDVENAENASFLAIVAVHTAENEPPRICGISFDHFNSLLGHSRPRAVAEPYHAAASPQRDDCRANVQDRYHGSGYLSVLHHFRRAALCHNGEDHRHRSPGVPQGDARGRCFRSAREEPVAEGVGVGERGGRRG